MWFFRRLCQLEKSLLVEQWSSETNPIPTHMLPPQYSFDDATPSHLVLYSGLLNDLSRYKLMGRYSWSQAFPSSVWGPDPAVADVLFNHAESSALARQADPAPLPPTLLLSASLSSPSTSSTSVIRSSSGHASSPAPCKCSTFFHRSILHANLFTDPKLNKAEPRNKSKDPVSPLLPQAIHAWSEASALVGRDFNHGQPACPGVLCGYVLPGPALFVTQKADTMQEYLRMYLKLQVALMY